MIIVVIIIIVIVIIGVSLPLHVVVPAVDLCFLLWLLCYVEMTC